MAKSFFGLDIGTYSVKMVEIDSEDNRPKLKNYAIVEIFGEDEYDPEGPGYNRLSNAIRTCFKQMKLVPKRVKSLSCSMGGPNVAVKQFRSIPLGAEELESSLTFEARKHLPLDDTEAIIDFQILEGGADATFMDILLVATTKKAFENHLKILEAIGVKPKVVESESTALVNSYLLSKGNPGTETGLVFLNIGARSTNLTIFCDKNILFSREIPIAGYRMTDDIRAIGKIDYNQAENLKKEKGMGAFLINPEGEGAAIRVARRMAHEGLIDEIKRSLRYYSKETGVREFDRILLSGGSSLMLNLNSHLAQALSMTVEVYNPFAMFSLPPGFTDSMGAQLAIAGGLAMRED